MSHDDSLHLTYHREGADVVVEVNGELDVASAPDLRHGLRELIEGQGNLHVTIDLTGLSFLDAAGLHVLNEARERFLTRGGSLALRSPPRPARRLLAITGLRDAFGLGGSRAASPDVIDIRESAATAGPDDEHAASLSQVAASADEGPTS